jgi:serine/threonine protein kinase
MRIYTIGVQSLKESLPTHGSIAEESRFVQTARRLQRLLTGHPDPGRHFPVAEVEWLNRKINVELSQRRSISIEEARNFLWGLQSPLVPEFGRLRLIAHGGNGMILSGISSKDRQSKAVKIGLKPDGPLYEREFQMQSRFDSPRIIRVEELGTTPHGEPYLIMEHIEGMSLLDYLELQDDEGDRFDLDQTLAIAREACAALAVCHRAGIVHRDVTLVNFILSEGQGLKLAVC